MTKTKTSFANQLVKATFKDLLQSICTYPKNLELDIMELPSKITVTARPHADDYGKLIGTKAKTHKAVQMLLSMAGQKATPPRDVRYIIAQPVVGVESPIRTKFQLNRQWNSQFLVNLMLGVAGLLSAGRTSVEPVDSMETTALILRTTDWPYNTDQTKQINEALGTIFHAIGRAHGRAEVVIEIIIG